MEAEQQVPIIPSCPVPQSPELTKGMTPDEVRQALGDPARSISGGLGDQKMEWWSYANGLEVKFRGGKLQNWYQTGG
jgi:hypothetical protein